ncbi:acyl-CoA dehydrogenase family protein [Modestobacter sp. VKM Ac-2985]|uniref:acyl-CoA dehydrogenase family protein n=1 Tax=Modestobacter sp. VKM Ac-2985 TaxID=3004139 RepID=UPI0022ABB09F|nr:acyl-CoA dehydrogenase family protein [Modestobacter sp. VKM Ac-2985]MCZ2839116.1 acyl-CoA dehydrogenase family protein [Modestobacter sp. VKM Ac-2985]
MASQPSYEQSKQVAESSRETEWTQPSFGKQLFLGDFRLDLVHPQPELDVAAVEKGEAFLERLRTFLTERVERQRIESEAKIPDDVLRGLGELGALGMKIPEEYGGLGLSQVYYNRALAMAGTWHSSISTLLSAHQSIGLPEPLRLFGSEEQKCHWLPRLARDQISAFLLTEPDVGSDPARMSTTAVPTDDGTGYRINGTKLWATNGAIADVVVVMAVVPGSNGHRGGITAFLCPCDRAGITVEHRNEFMGLRGIENSVTRFDDVFVPTEDVIGGEGRGLRIALTTLNTGRLSLPAFCSSAVKYSLKIAREWSAERRQWGRPIGEHDPVAQKLAWLAGTAFGLEAVLDVSSRLADDKRNDIRIEAALAKLYSSELGWTAVDEMVQIRGGRAYETAESLARRGEKPVPAEQLLRDMRINRVFEGSTEIMHLLIAREAVDEHLKVAGDLVLGESRPADRAKAAVKAGAFYARWLPTLATGAGQRRGSYAEFGALAEHLRYVERHSRKLARSTFYAMGRHRARLEQKGHLLGRIVDIGAELYAISCACAYADTIGSEQPARRQEAAELADLFCRQARRRADRLFGELWDNDDHDQYRAAQQLLSGRYAWFEEDVLDPAGDGPMMPTHEPPAAEQFDEPAPTVPAAPAS